jgi:hypothetical protein
MKHSRLFGPFEDQTQEFQACRWQSSERPITAIQGPSQDTEPYEFVGAFPEWVRRGGTVITAEGEDVEWRKSP